MIARDILEEVPGNPVRIGWVAILRFETGPWVTVPFNALGVSIEPARIVVEAVWHGMRTRENADFREVFRCLSGCGL
jgi:hypothetical protein